MSKSNFTRPTPSKRRCHRKCACWRGGSRDSQRLISTQIAKAEEEARKKRAAALAEAEAAAKKKLADEAQALAKAHAEAAAKERAAAEKRKAEEEKARKKAEEEAKKRAAAIAKAEAEAKAAAEARAAEEVSLPSRLESARAELSVPPTGEGQGPGEGFSRGGRHQASQGSRGGGRRGVQESGSCHYLCGTVTIL